MSNAVSSLIFACRNVNKLIFACRNVNKTENGEIGRAPVAAAQSINVLNQISKYNKVIAKGTDAAVSVFDNLAQKSKVVDYTVKGVKWATKNVNPLICVSGGVKVLMSDDKTTAAVKEVAALSTMFAGEAVAKKLLPKLIAKLPVGSKAGAIINGLLFVGASIASYSVGEKLGTDLAKEVKTNWAKEPQKINQMA